MRVLVIYVRYRMWSGFTPLTFAISALFTQLWVDSDFWSGYPLPEVYPSRSFFRFHSNSRPIPLQLALPPSLCMLERGLPRGHNEVRQITFIADPYYLSKVPSIAQNIRLIQFGCQPPACQSATHPVIFVKYFSFKSEQYEQVSNSRWRAGGVPSTSRSRC